MLFKEGIYLKLDITSIIKNSGSTIHISEKEFFEDLGTGIGTVDFTGPVEFKGSVTNFNGMLILKGIARVNYSTVCDRCGEKIDRELAVDIDEDIVEKAQAGDGAEEKAREAEDDRFAFSGNVLELDRILVDCIVTNLPMTHLCRENCPGLCPVCGRRIKGESCECEHQHPVDPRFEALKGFFD